MKVVGVCACTVGIAHTYIAQEKLEKAAEYSKNAKEGSLASKANLVSRYNSSNSKK